MGNDLGRTALTSPAARLARVLLPAVLAACAPLAGEEPLPETPGRAASAGCPLPADAAGLRAGMLRSVNARRAAAGLAPLRSDPRLERAAAIIACDNARRGRMTHVTTGGADLRARVRGQGYGFSLTAEALAHGYRDAGRLEAIWAGSAYHRPTLLTPSTRDAGVAVVLSPSGSPWWAMISAAPR